MNNVCCICLEEIKDKSFLQKCFDTKKTCICQYYIHNLCFFDYINHKILEKRDIACIVCKSQIIEYKSCIKKTKIVYKKIVSYIEFFIMILKILAITIITSTFLQLLIQLNI